MTVVLSIGLCIRNLFESVALLVKLQLFEGLYGNSI
jgi:hypothetical protein